MDYSTLQIFGCPAYSLDDSQKKNKLEFKLRSISSSSSLKESRASAFGISRQQAPLPEEMWSLTKKQCCKPSQRRRIKSKVERQIVRQTLRKKELSSHRALKGLTGQKMTPQIQMETNRRQLKSNLNR